MAIGDSIVHAECDKCGEVTDQINVDRMAKMIQERDRERGRPLTHREKINNLVHSLAECDADCESRKGQPCDCGAQNFKAKFGSGQYTS